MATEDLRLAERVRRALADVPGVEERRMSGGLAFLVAGTLRIAVGSHADRVAVVRTGPGQAAALQRPGVEPMTMRGRRLTGRVALSEQAVASDEDFAHRVAVGLAAGPPGKVSTSGSGAGLAPPAGPGGEEQSDR